MASVRPFSYGCTWEVANHERSVRVARGNNQVRLQQIALPQMGAARVTRLFFLIQLITSLIFGAVVAGLRQYCKTETSWDNRKIITVTCLFSREVSLAVAVIIAN